jgi:hypothetical protein
MTVDGFFAGLHGEIDWFKADRDPGCFWDLPGYWRQSAKRMA